jgi:deoxyadenosine/deoxycytidine kinase
MLFKNGSDPRGFKIVTDFFDYTEELFGLPDLLVHLQVSPETQLKRVKSRRRSFENEVTLEYLQDLKRELDGVVAESKSKGVNIIEIDTEEIFLPEHHLFAAELAENIEKRLNFCINPITKKAV